MDGGIEVNPLNELDLRPGALLEDRRGNARVLATVQAKAGLVVVLERTRASGSRYPYPFLQHAADMRENGWMPANQERNHMNPDER